MSRENLELGDDNPAGLGRNGISRANFDEEEGEEEA